MDRDLNSFREQCSNSNCVIIEFVGIPGVGKSTLSRRTAAILANKYPQVTEPIRCISNRSAPYRILSKGYFAVQHLVRHPRTSFSAAHTLLNTNQTSVIDRIRVSFNLQYVSGVIARAQSNHGVTLLDQGPYQSVWSVGLRSSCNWEVLFDRFDQFLSRNAPDLVVCVEATPKTVTERLNNRLEDSNRFSENSSQFNRAIEGYRQLRCHLATSDCQTITICNETKKMLEPNATQIVEEIGSLSVPLHY